MIIDTHCHTGLFKYEPVESLLYHMEKSGVEKAVFIQYMGNTDNGYMLECINAHPNRFAAAMCVSADDDGSQIRHWAERGISGIRLNASFRGSGTDSLIHWRTAAELGLVVSAPCNPTSLLSAEFREVVETFPNLAIVIEHLAGIGRGAEEPYTLYKEVMALAAYPNLTIKLPGFGEFCDVTSLFSSRIYEDQQLLSELLDDPAQFFWNDIPPLPDLALEAFGPQRMMWGSDYPPVSSREGYALSLKLPQRYFSQLSQDEQDQIFGRTAAQVWGLGS